MTEEQAMGWWNHGADGSSLHCDPTGLVWGDGPADEVYRVMFGRGKKAAKRAERCGRRQWDAFVRIREQFRDAFDRDPTKEEMRAGLLFAFGQIRRFIADLPDGPAPAPPQSAPGILNVGPMSTTEWAALGDFLAADESGSLGSSSTAAVEAGGDVAGDG